MSIRIKTGTMHKTNGQIYCHQFHTVLKCSYITYSKSGENYHVYKIDMFLHNIKTENAYKTKNKMQSNHRTEYYTSAMSFRCAIRFNEFEGFI